MDQLQKMQLFERMNSLISLSDMQYLKKNKRLSCDNLFNEFLNVESR